MLISPSFCQFLVVQSLARVGQWRDSSVAESCSASYPTELICTDGGATISGLRFATPTTDSHEYTPWSATP